MGEQSTVRREGVTPTAGPGPWGLRPEDWRRAMETDANVLLVGAPRSMADVLEELPALQQPIVTWRAGERFNPPAAACAVGTMILSGVEALPPSDQQRLYQWLQRRSSATKVFSTAARSLLPLVDQGAFHDGLYDRLNTVCIELTDAVTDDALPGWLRVIVLEGRDDSWSGTAERWSLRIKPDRRQVQLPMASGEDRRRR